MISHANTDAVSFLVDNWRQGNQIVPFIGAGASAGSGFPLTADLRAYFCKVHFYITKGIFRRSFGQDFSAPSGRTPHSLERRPSEFLRKIGWPDYNRITSMLWSYADAPLIGNRPPMPGLGHTNRKDLSELREAWYLIRTNPEFAAFWQDGQIPTSNHLNILIESVLKRARPFARGRARIESLVQQVLVDAIRYDDSERARHLDALIWRGDLRDIRVDWFRLLLDLVEGELGLIDDLFSQLSRQYEPSLSHIAVALLARHLGWNLILTLNHDTILERAFAQEGLTPKVFDVSRDADVPDASTVSREPLSIVKLHGSAYGIRVGEPTNYALDDITRTRILTYVPRSAVILVIGFSGYERRMMSVIESFADTHHTIAWLHWEPKERLPEPAKRLSDRFPANFLTFRLRDAGSFLMGLLQRATRNLPHTRGHYRALPKRVFSPVEAPSPELATYLNTLDSRLPPVRLFCPAFIVNGFRTPTQPFSGRIEPGIDPGQGSVWSASAFMSEFVHSLRNYRTIWIDLEEHHTVTGVVTEIIDKLRVFDPMLPPLMLPVDDDPGTYYSTKASAGIAFQKRFDRAVRYIHRAVKSGQYVIAFDSLEGFCRPHTQHHGVPGLLPRSIRSDFDNWAQIKDWYIKGRFEAGQDTKDQLHSLAEARPYTSLIDFGLFFQQLIGRESIAEAFRDPSTDSPHIAKYDWYCCLAFDSPTPRHLHQTDIPLPVRDSTVPTPKTDTHLSDSPLKLQQSLCDGILDELTTLYHFAKSTQDLCDTFPCPSGSPPDKPPNLIEESLCWMRSTFASSTAECLDTVFTGRKDKSFHEGQPHGIINKWIHGLCPDATSGNPGRLCADLLACSLSVFRRPRSLAAVEWIVKDLLNASDSHEPASAVCDNLIGILTSESAGYFLQRAEGECYSIATRVHEFTYKLFTGPTWFNAVWQGKDVTWNKVFEEAGADISAMERLCGVLLRSAYLARIHSSAARFYYIHAWQRSRDVTALYEYLYHRLSSVRYATFVRLLLRRSEPISKTEGDIRESPFKRCLRTLKILLPRDQPHETAFLPINRQTPSSTQDLTVETLVSHIDKLREEYLQVLLGVLERERHTIRAGAPAATWIAWCECIFSRSPLELGNWGTPKGMPLLASASSSDLKNLKAIPANFKIWRSDSTQVMHLLWQLQLFFLDVQAHLYREAGAYSRCLGTRYKTLVMLVGEKSVVAKHIMRAINNKPFSAMDKLVSFFQKKNINAQMAIGEFVTSMIASDENRGMHVIPVITNSILDIASSLRYRPRRNVSPRHRDRLSTPLVRLFIFAHSIADSCLLQLKESRREEGIRSLLLQLRMDCRFEELRFRIELLESTDADPRNALGHLLRPTARARGKEHNGSSREGKSERVWKTAETLLKDIVDAQGHIFSDPVVKERLLMIYTSKLSNLRARALCILERYHESLKALDESESGISENEHETGFLRAIIYQVRARVRQKLANSVIGRPMERHEMSSSDKEWKKELLEVNDTDRMPVPVYLKKVHGVAGYARTQLGLARRDLEFAESALKRWRRSLSSWRRLYEGQAQQAVEELLLLSLHLECGHEECGATQLDWEVRVQHIVGRGLEAIRGGMDCVVYHVEVKRPDDESEEFEGIQSDLVLVDIMRHSLLTLWVEILTVSYALLQIDWNAKASAPGTAILASLSDRRDGRFESRWAEMNRAAGLIRCIEALESMKNTGVSIIYQVHDALCAPADFPNARSGSQQLTFREQIRWAMKQLEGIGVAHKIADRLDDPTS